ncbi:type II secretion system protein GspM [Thalassotalea fusca]
MKAWWNQLNSREQRLIASLGGVLLIFLFYSLVWQPLNESIERGEQKVKRHQELLQFVSDETHKYRQLKGTGVKPSGGSISSIVNRTANRSGIKIDRMQPQGEEIQVWLDDVSFNALVTWVELLSSNEGIQVKSIDLSKAEQAGQVRVRRMQLGRS